MLAVIPKAVVLRFNAGGSVIDVYDERTNELVTTDNLHGVATWLELLGFVWRPGSNGIWQRAA